MIAKETKRNELERRRILERALSTILSGMLAMSVCSTAMIAFASDGFGATYEGTQTERVVTELIESDSDSNEDAEAYSVVFSVENASIECNGLSITGQQSASVSSRNDLVFTVATDEGFAVEDVSFQLLSEGVLDVLEPTETTEGAQYTIAADKMTEGMAIVVDTVVIDAEDPRSGDEPADARTEGDILGTYAVKHHLQNDDGTYTCVKSDSFEGKVGDKVQAQPGEYPLYTLNKDVSTLTGTISGGEASDSELVLDLFYDSISLTVTGHGISANVRDVEKVYDGQPISVQASIDQSGYTLLYYTDGMSGWSAENPRFTDAGTYTVLVKAVDPNESKTDVATAHVTVKPAPVVIKVRDAEKAVGSADPAFEGAVEGLIPGDEIGSVVYYRLNSGVEEAGSYADVLSALVQHRNGNYAYTVTPGSFTIKGDAAPAQNPVNDQMSSIDPAGSEPVDPNLVEEFSQGEGMQRFTESVVEPIATLLGVAKADRTTIDDDETPLSTFEDDEQEGCWVHLLIILGAFITAVGGAIAVLRRLHQTWRMDDDLDEVCSLDPYSEDDDALPALDALRTW